LAGFLHFALETHWQRFGQFLYDLLRNSIFDFRDLLSDFRKIVSEFSLKNRDFCRNFATKIAKNRIGNPT